MHASLQALAMPSKSDTIARVPMEIMRLIFGQHV
jgi:hypothetical protein